MTIKLSHREVDIVVHDEKEQNNLVKYLLYKINTIDGIAGSADKILSVLESQGIESYRKKQKIPIQKFSKKDVPNAFLTRMRLKNKLNVMRQAYLKYTVIKFRIKVSWIAFTKKMTIMELFTRAIQKSYDQLNKEGYKGLVQLNKAQILAHDRLFVQIKNDLSIGHLFTKLIEANLSQIEGTSLH